MFGPQFLDNDSTKSETVYSFGNGDSVVLGDFLLLDTENVEM